MAGLHARPTSGKLEASNKDLREPSYVTGQPIGSNRRALDVIGAGVYQVGVSPRTILTGSDDNIVVMTAHGAKIGDVLRILTSANSVNEFEVHIDEIIDANTFKLSSVLSAQLANGDTATILRPISQRMSSDGASLATVAPSPIVFTLDGVNQDVTEDTVTPANNRPLPVKLTGVTGDINITAGDLNVQLTDIGASADKVRLGDGSGKYAGITANNEIQTHDEDVLSELFLHEALLTTIDTSADKIADGLGTTLDASEDDHTQPATLIAATKGINENLNQLQAQLPTVLGQNTMANSLPVVIASNQSAVPVSGSVAVNNFPASQAITAAALPLPAGAATDAKLDTIITAIGNQSTAQSTAALQGTANTSLANIDSDLGSPADAAVIIPSSSASVIAALKGLMSLIIQSNTKLDTIDTNTAGGGVGLTSASSTLSAAATAQTLTAPLGAVGMIIQNSTAADDSVRFTPSATTPTASSGFLLGPGQSTSYMPAGSVKVIATASGVIDVTVLWFA